MLGYYNPHSPYISAPRHKDAFRLTLIGIGSLTGLPASMNRTFATTAVPGGPGAVSPEEINTTHLQILRSLLSVDDGVARFSPP